MGVVSIIVGGFSFSALFTIRTSRMGSMAEPCSTTFWNHAINFNSMQTTRFFAILTLLSVLSLIALCLAATAARAAEPQSPVTILVEAEAFDDYGGWVLDQQFMDQMGSPYLLAHGLGIPVKDATTKVRVPRTDTYHVFVRTRDWVATWNAKGSPGRFQLLVNGKPLSTTFGTEGAAVALAARRND